VSKGNNGLSKKEEPLFVKGESGVECMGTHSKWSQLNVLEHQPKWVEIRGET